MPKTIVEMPYKIYLDACCLNRPFDNWEQARIRLEAEAVLTILRQCEEGAWSLVSSTALDAEISRTPEPTKKQRVLNSLSIATQKVLVVDTIMKRAAELKQFGIKTFDALHLACSESVAVDIFLTTDDRLLRSANRAGLQLQIRECSQNRVGQG